MMWSWQGVCHVELSEDNMITLDLMRETIKHYEAHVLESL